MMQSEEQLAKRNEKRLNVVIGEISNEIVRALDNKNANNFFSRQGRDFVAQFQSQAEKKNIGFNIYQDAIREPDIFQKAILAISGFIESNKKHSFVNDIFEEALITQPQKMVTLMRTLTIADFPFRADGTLEYALETKSRDNRGSKDNSRRGVRDVFTVKLNGTEEEFLHLSSREGAQGEVRGKRLIEILELEHVKSLQPDYIPRTLEQIVGQDPATQKAERIKALSTLEELVLNQTQAGDWELQEGCVTNLPDADLIHLLSLVNTRLEGNARDTGLAELYAPLTKDELIQIISQGISLRDLQQENSLPKKMITEYGYDKLLDDHIVELFESYSIFYQKDQSLFDEMQKINIFDDVHQSILSQIWQLSQRHRHESQHHNARLATEQIQALYPFLASSLGQCRIADFKTQELIALGQFIEVQAQLSKSLAELDSLLSVTGLSGIKVKLDAAKSDYLENPTGKSQEHLKQQALKLCAEVAEHLGNTHFANNKIQRELGQISQVDFTPSEVESQFLVSFVQKSDNVAARQQEQLIISLQASMASVMAESLSQHASVSLRSMESQDIKLKQAVASLFEDNIFEGQEGQQLYMQLMSSKEHAYMGVSDGFLKIAVLGQGSSIDSDSGATTKESIESDLSVRASDITLTSPLELNLKLKNEAVATIESIFKAHQAASAIPPQQVMLSEVFSQSAWFTQQLQESEEKISPVTKAALEISEKVKKADIQDGRSAIAEHFHASIDLQRLQQMASIASKFPHRDIVSDLFSVTERQGQEDKLRETLAHLKITDLPFDLEGKLQYQRDRENAQLIIYINTDGGETVLRFDDRATANELRGMAVISAFEQAYAITDKNTPAQSLDSVLRSCDAFIARNVSAVVRPLERVAIEDYQDFCTQVEPRPLQIGSEMVQALIPALERDFQRPVSTDEAWGLVQSHQEVFTEKTIAERKEFYLAAFTSEKANELYDRKKAYEVFEKYGSFYKNSPLFSPEGQLSASHEQHDNILPLLWRLSQQHRQNDAGPELSTQKIEQLFPIIVATNGVVDLNSIDESTLSLFTRLHQQSEATTRSEVLMLLEYCKNPSTQSLSESEQDADRIFIKNQKHVFQLLGVLSNFIDRYAQSTTESFNEAGQKALQEVRQQLLESQKDYIADGNLDKLRSKVGELCQNVKADIQTQRTYQWVAFLQGFENIWRAFKKYFWPESNPSLMSQTSSILRELAAQEQGKPAGDYAVLEQLLKNEALESLSSVQQLEFKERFLKSQASIIEQNRTTEVGQALAQAEASLLAFATTALPVLLGSPVPLAELFTKEQLANHALEHIKKIACSDITAVTSNNSGAVLLHLKSGEIFEIGSQHAFNQIPELKGAALTDFLASRPADASTLEAFLEKILLQKRVEGALNAVLGTISIDMPVLSGAELAARISYLVQKTPDDIALSTHEIKLANAYLKSLSENDRACLGSLATVFEQELQPTSCDLKKLYLFAQYANGSYRQERDQAILARSIHTKDMSQDVVDLYLSQNHADRAAIPGEAFVSAVLRGCQPSIDGVTWDDIMAILTKPQQPNELLSEAEVRVSAGLKDILETRDDSEKAIAFADSYQFARENKFDKNSSWQSMRNIIFEGSLLDSAEVDLFKIFSELKIKDINGISFQHDGSQQYLELRYQEAADEKVLRLSARGSGNGEVRGEAMKSIIEQAIATAKENPSTREKSLKDLILGSQKYQEYTEFSIMTPLYAGVSYKATQLFEEQREFVDKNSLLGKMLTIEELSQDTQQQLQKLSIPYYAFSAADRSRIFDVFQAIYQCECSLGATLEPSQIQTIMEYVVSQSLLSVENTEEMLPKLQEYLSDFKANLHHIWLRDAQEYLDTFSDIVDKSSLVNDINKLQRVGQLLNALKANISQDMPLNPNSPADKELAKAIYEHVVDNNTLSFQSLRQFSLILHQTDSLGSYAQSLVVEGMGAEWKLLGDRLSDQYSARQLNEIKKALAEFKEISGSPYHEVLISSILSYIAKHSRSENYEALSDTDFHLLKQLSYIHSELESHSLAKEMLGQAIKSFVQNQDLVVLSAKLPSIQVQGAQKDLWQTVSDNIHTATEAYPSNPQAQRTLIAATIKQQALTKVWPPRNNPPLQTGAAASSSFLSQNVKSKKDSLNR